MRKREQGFGEVVVGFVVLLLIVGVIALLTSMRFVDTGNIGVVSAYGKVTGRELTEGFSWVAPFGGNNVTEYSIKTQKEQQNATSATRDLQDVTAKVVVNYHLERGKVSEIHQTVGPKYKDVLITPAIQSVFKSVTARYNAVELQSGRDKAESDATTGLRKRLESKGIVIETVSIVDLTYSREFTKAIEQRQVAQQNAERAKYNLEQARLDAQSQEVQAKTLTPEYLRLKELENQNKAIDKWNGQMPNTVAGSGNIFSIPVK
jgi:regulator of protease activity HflC (stomatin/prohibitin superfamily)